MHLAGIRVVELGQAIAGPFGSQILGDFGAEIIKIEKPEGDDARYWGKPYWGYAATMFHAMNRNKLSVTLDVTEPAGRQQFYELIDGADVFIHNLRPGVVGKLELDPATLMARNPRLIYCDISAFGDRGPLVDRPGYELFLQAFSGLMSLTGEPDGRAMRASPPINDIGTGMWAAIGILAALQGRHQTGKGCVVRTSLLETAMTWMCDAVASYLGSGDAPARVGNSHPQVSPYGDFAAADGRLILGAPNDRLFAKLATALERPELATDERFRDVAGRVANRSELDGILGPILAARPRDHWMRLFADAGVPCMPVASLPEVVDHPQTEAIGILCADPENPQARTVGSAVSFDGQRPKIRTSPPRLGEHTDRVLGGGED